MKTQIIKYEMADYRKEFQIINSTLFHENFYEKTSDHIIEGFELSLAKWYILSTIDVKDDRGTSTDGLCMHFYDYNLDCNECPVMKKTGKKWCYNTPHDNYISCKTDKKEPAKQYYLFLLELAREVCPEVEWINWFEEDAL